MLENVKRIGGIPSDPCKVEHNDEGIVWWYTAEFQNKEMCIPRFIEWGESMKLQYCKRCNKAYRGHSAQPCFECAVGLK